APKIKLAKLLPEPENVACRSMLTPCRVGVLYPARRAAAAADPNDRGAWNVGGEASGEWRAASE
ncbi:MAG: hypothetical protein WA746_27460, partial [Isosphaeraceae bacterium]